MGFLNDFSFLFVLFSSELEKSHGAITFDIFDAENSKINSDYSLLLRIKSQNLEEMSCTNKNLLLHTSFHASKISQGIVFVVASLHFWPGFESDN